MRKLTFLVLAIITAYSLGGCKKTKESSPSQFVVSAQSLSFHDNETQTLYVTTDPSTTCEFQVISYPDWVKVIPLSGLISNNIKAISVSSEFAQNQQGYFEGVLTILSTLGTVSVNLTGTASELTMYTIPDSIFFSVFSDSQLLSIDNLGNTILNFSVTLSNGVVSVSPASGSIAVGETMDLTVDVNRTGMETGTYASMVLIDINGLPDSVPVTVEHILEKKMMLTCDVADAEYSKSTNQLVFVSATPSRLNIFNPFTETIESISLTYLPTCVSLSPDGQTAVVGHDGHISYIDLIGKVMIREFNVSCEALDIVLGGNQWAYTFPKHDQWERIRCINVSLPYDNEVLHTGSSIYAGTKAKLHPSGKYIYGTDNGLSPSDMEKYDIQSGGAVYLYDSPYHGDYPINGDLWFSQDGIRAFTRGKTVLKLSELQEQDMLYNGSIALESTYARIVWLDHSAAKNNLYLVSSGESYWNDVNPPFIYVYNASNLVYQTKYELEKYPVPNNTGGGNIYDAEPYFVFADASGDRIFILTKASGSGLLNEWSIQKIDIE